MSGWLGTAEGLRDAHAGELVLVLGNSSSLLDMPDLREALKFTTVGTNRILETVPRVDYVIAVDDSVIKDQYLNLNGAFKTGTTIIVFPSAITKKNSHMIDFDMVDLGKLSPDADVAAADGPMHICPGGNTGYYAVQLAFRMGAKIIAMAGIDLYWPPGRNSHACGDGKELGCKLGDTVDGKILAFAKMARRYEKFGVQLVSVSPWRTRLRKVVGHSPMSEVLKSARLMYEESARSGGNDGQG